MIRAPSDNHKIIGEKLDERLDFIKNQGGKDPWGKRVDKIYRKAMGNSQAPAGNESEN
ncbi:hypothetical protein D3C87_1744720 [compost metagenome]